MLSAGVVQALDVLEDRSPRDASGGPAAANSMVMKYVAITFVDVHLEWEVRSDEEGGRQLAAATGVVARSALVALAGDR